MLAKLFEDEHLLVVDKPSGSIVHKGIGQDGPVIVEMLRKMGESAAPVHRLDRGTSGVLVCAKHADAARRLTEIFTAGQVEKRYLALVRGQAPETFDLDHPVPSGPDRHSERVPARTEGVRLSFVITQPREVSWMLVRPRTGRFHQIRRHFKHMSHPIVGDSTHGKGPLNREFKAVHGLERMALHAVCTRFRHPMQTEIVTILAPLPLDLVIPLERMGIDPCAGYEEDRWFSTPYEP